MSKIDNMQQEASCKLQAGARTQINSIDCRLLKQLMESIDSGIDEKTTEKNV